MVNCFFDKPTVVDTQFSVLPGVCQFRRNGTDAILLRRCAPSAAPVVVPGPFCFVFPKFSSILNFFFRLCLGRKILMWKRALFFFFFFPGTFCDWPIWILTTTTTTCVPGGSASSRRTFPTRTLCRTRRWPWMPASPRSTRMGKFVQWQSSLYNPIGYAIVLSGSRVWGFRWTICLFLLLITKRCIWGQNRICPHEGIW